VPVIESGSALREKFLRLEDAIKRQKNPYKQKQPVNNIGYREIEKRYQVDAQV
jgi:hypothetical protein